MAEKLLTLMPCPKCGAAAPVLNQTYRMYCSGGEDEERCIRWLEGQDEWTSKRYCGCREYKYSWLRSHSLYKVNKRCKECNGTGELMDKVTPAVPERLEVTCPMCLHVRDVPPLDAKKD